MSSETTVKEVTVADLAAFADAWNRHDVDTLMSFMTADCIYDASAGPEICGRRYEGALNVRQGFAGILDKFPDAHWAGAKHFICGSRGVSEWIFTGTEANGTKVEVHGCDVFTFRNGKIAVKNAYRKIRTAG